MPIYTVETTYRLPVYRQHNYRAATPDEACRRAIEDDSWEDAKEDVETSGETYVTGLWKGGDAAYSGQELPIPDGFDETVQRKADLFEALVEIVRESARPLGLFEYQFEHWLPRALTVLAAADAITGGCVPPRS